MEENQTITTCSRKELRKQKLMEYLSAKGKMKPHVISSCRNDVPREKSSLASVLKVVVGKENKAPAKRDAANASKAPISTTQRNQEVSKRALVINGSTRTGRQNVTRPLPNNVPAKPKPQPDLTRTYTVVSSKFHLSTTKHLSDRPTNALFRAPGVRAKSSSSQAAFHPNKAVSARLSIAPVIKTRTGLTPAVIQPRTTATCITQRPPTTARVGKKTQPSSSSSAFVSQKSAGFVSSSIKARENVQARNKTTSDIKAFLVKHMQPASQNHQPSTGARAMPKPVISKSGSSVVTKKPTYQPAGGAVKPKSGASEGKKRQIYNAAPRCSSSRAETKIEKTAQNKKDQTTTTNRQVKTKLNPPVVSHTVLNPSRTKTFPGHAADTKAPKVKVKVGSKTEEKKSTKAQEDRMRKLQEWRETKGISYKRPPMLVKPPTRRNAEDEAQSLIFTVDRSLTDCIKLLAQGCAPHQVKGILSRLPAVAKKFAKYWICQARLMEREGNLDILPMFEEAVRVVLEPVDELRTVVFDILKKKDEIKASEQNASEEDLVPEAESSPENPMKTPKPTRLLISGEKEGSSVVKYKITATPGGPLSHQKKPVQVKGQEVLFFTPVRRSVRIEKASVQYPTSLLDHDVCVASYDDFISEEAGEKREEQQTGESPPSTGETLFVYRENEPLNVKMHLQLVYDSSPLPSS